MSVDESLPARAINADVLYNLGSLCELIVLSDMHVPPGADLPKQYVGRLFTKGYVQQINLARLNIVSFFGRVLDQAHQDLSRKGILKAEARKLYSYTSGTLSPLK